MMAFLRFSPVFLSSQESVAYEPVMRTLRPLRQYSATSSACFSQTWQSMNSVVRRSPEPSLIAMENDATAFPVLVYRISGSRVRLPEAMTRFTLDAPYSGGPHYTALSIGVPR